MTRLELTEYGTADLGTLIDALNVIKCTESCRLFYDFGSLFPTETACSYRGAYDHAAIQWAGYHDVVRAGREPAKPMHPHRFAEYLAEWVVAQVFAGWKGGEYTMHRHSPLWVAESGDDSGTAIIGLTPLGRDSHPHYDVVINTGYVAQ